MESREGIGEDLRGVIEIALSSVKSELSSNNPTEQVGIASQ